MDLFSVGEQVIIRFGRPQGKKAQIIQKQTKDIYKVRFEDGTVLYFTGKGLRKVGILEAVCRNR